MLLVRLPANSRPLIVKFGVSQKLYMGFQLYRVGGGEVGPVTPMLCKGQLYLAKRFGNCLFVMVIFFERERTSKGERQRKRERES